MEQVNNAVAAVKAGRGVNVSERRVAELKAQFPDKREEPAPKDGDAKEEPAFTWKPDPTLTRDVGLWSDLAKVWFARL